MDNKISSWFSKHEVTIALVGAVLTFLWSTHSMDSRMLAMEQRIDKLYEMFVDLVKESRK